MSIFSKIKSTAKAAAASSAAKALSAPENKEIARVFKAKQVLLPANPRKAQTELIRKGLADVQPVRQKDGTVKRYMYLTDKGVSTLRVAKNISFAQQQADKRAAARAELEDLRKRAAKSTRVRKEYELRRESLLAEATGTPVVRSTFVASAPRTRLRRRAM